MHRLTTAHRTCDLILGVGDAKVLQSLFTLCNDECCCIQLNQFRGVQYSASVANFFTWDNLRPTADWHPHIPDVVYWGEYS